MAVFGPERSEPNDEDGQMDSQDMPTTDGEMAEPGAAAPAGTDDPSGMRGQVDDSASGLRPGDDEDEARRGIPQVGDAVTAEGRPDAPAADAPAPDAGTPDAGAPDADDRWDGADAGPE